MSSLASVLVRFDRRCLLSSIVDDEDVDVDFEAVVDAFRSGISVTTLPILALMLSTGIVNGGSHLSVTILACHSSYTLCVVSDHASMSLASVHATDTWKDEESMAESAESVSAPAIFLAYSAGCPTDVTCTLHRSRSVNSGLFRELAPLTAALNTRNARAESGLRNQSRPSNVISKRPTPDKVILSTSCVKNCPFSAVVNTNGRDKLMCRGSGAPRSLVRKEWKAASSPKDERSEDNNRLKRS